MSRKRAGVGDSQNTTTCCPPPLYTFSAERRPLAVKADCRYTTRSCEGPVVKTQPATEKNGARPAECEQETRGEQPHMTQNGYPKSSARPRADLDRDRWIPITECQPAHHEVDPTTPPNPETKPIARTQQMLRHNWHRKTAALPAHAAVAQLAARRSHNPKVGSSILSCRISSNAELETGRGPGTSK